MAVDYYIAGATEGQGVNLGFKTLHNHAVVGEFSTSTPTASGSRVQYSLEVVKSQERLMEKFTLSVKASYSGLFTASASADFLSKSEFSRFRTYVVAQCVVSFPDHSIKNPKMKPEVLREAGDMTEEEFHRFYGTEFLSGMQTGGYYFGVIEIESTSSEEQKSISVAVSASGWGAKVDGSISSKLEAATSHLSKKVFVVRHGANSLKIPNTPDEIINQAITFPEFAQKEPDRILGIYQRYDQTFNLKFKQGPKVFDLYKRSDDLQLLGRRYLKLRQLRNDYEYVINHYNDHVMGSGVIFELGGQSFGDKPLSAADATALASVRVESDDGDVSTLPRSAQVTIDSIEEELSAVDKKLAAVTEAADRCKDGHPYKVPPAYVAKIGLPVIKGRNLELELIRGRLVPPGTIMMWSGPAAAIPGGWLLCDGTKGTPDLRGRFIMGAGTGGPDPHANGEADQHAHTVGAWFVDVSTSLAGEHAHRFPASWYHRGLASGQFNGIDTNSETMDANLTVQASGQHSHALRINAPQMSTAPSAGENKPRWFALCFIMKGPE